MNCSIKDTLASKTLQASSRPVESGYFDTEKFIKQFGEWRPGKLSEAEIAENVLDILRFNEDGSPRLDINKYGVTFFTDKRGVRTPIIEEYFKTLPLEIRSALANEIMDNVVADLLLDYMRDNEDFLAGERVEGFDLKAYFRSRVDEYWRMDMIDLALISTRESEQDYLDGITAKLRNLGVKVENDAIKQAQSIERPTTDKASPTIRAMMQFVTNVDQSGVEIDSVALPGKPTFVKPSVVWGTILSHMADIPMETGKNMVEVYLAKLLELKTTHPWVEFLHEDLKDASDAVKVQFVTALNNVKNDVYITEYNDGIFTTKSAVGATTSKGKIKSEWRGILDNTVASLSEDQRDTIGVGLVSTVQEELENIPAPEEEDEVGDALLDVHASLAPLFEAYNLGVDENITMGAFNVYVDELYKGQGKSEGVDYLDAYKSFVAKVKDNILPTMQLAMTHVNETTSKNYADALDIFAESTLNIEDDSGVHMVTVGKNRIYIYSLPSVLQETINEWKNNPAMLKELAEEPTLRGSLLIQHLASRSDYLAQLTVGMRGVITQKHDSGRRESKDGGEISKGDYAKVDFYNAFRELKGKTSPIFNTQVPADKGKEFQLNIPGFFQETESIMGAATLFRGYVKNELNAMLAAEYKISEAINKEVAKLPEGIIKEAFANARPGQKSTEILSELVIKSEAMPVEEYYQLMGLIDASKNDLTVVYHLKGDTLIDTDLKSPTLGMYMGGAFNYTTAHSLNYVDGLKNTITGLPLPQEDMILDNDKALSDSINDVLADAVQNKVNSYTKAASDKYGIGLSDEGGIEGIDADTWQRYVDKAAENQELTREEINETAIKSLMRDFVTNYMISKIEYSHLFTGNMSFYKHTADYIKRVPATYVDGLQPVTGIEEGDETFTQMTFSTEEFKSPLSEDKNLDTNARRYYGKIEGTGKDVDRTDAQGYITPKRWRQILLSTGKLGTEAQKVYDKIIRQGKSVENGQPIAEADILSIKEIKVLSAQPLKGVYFKNEIGGTPTYLKFSQAVLLPQFVNNNPKAKQLLAYMEEHGIDEMVAQTGVKVGAKRPTPLFNTEGEFVGPDNPVLTTLDSRNYRIQQDLPTKAIKDTKIGVQVQKMIMSGLAFAGDTELLQDIENALGELSNIGLQDLYTRYGITPGESGSAKITDVQAFYQALIKDVLAKEVPEDNVLRALKAEVPISLLPMLKDSLQSQVFSTLRKAATNLMTPGGANIQISDQLIGKTEINKGGIKMLIPIDRLQPPLVREYEGRKIVQPGQVLIPHSMIYKLVPNYAELSTEELNDILKEEFREIIGYRIPTQAKASVDILEIVGIMPPEMGDSIITYGEITAKTGSDFDIDKMFIMLPELRMLNEQLVRATGGVKGARNKVLGLFKKVLKDPKYYNDMMTSVDNDTFKEGTLALLDKREAEDMDAWDPVRAIDTRFSYRTGGSGVAVSANSLSDHVLTQAKTVSIEFNQGAWGNKYLDAQFSESLTNAELEKLLDVINNKRTENNKGLMGMEEAKARLHRVAISGTLSELTNAFVDIANEDAFVTRGNWGNLTNGYGMMMVRQGIHPNKVSAILRQPAMIQLMEDITNQEGVVSNTPSYIIEENAITEWTIKAETAGINTEFMSNPQSGRLSDLSFNELMDSALSQEAISKKALMNQLILLKSFTQSKKAVKKYNNFVVTIKNDAKGAGRNTQDMFVRTNKFSDAYFPEVPGPGQVNYGLKNVGEKFFDGNGNNTLSYTMYNNTVGVATKIVNDNPMMFDSISQETFELFNRAAAQNTNDTRVTSVTQSDFLFNEFAAYKMSGFGPISKEDTKTEFDGFIKEIMELKASRKYTMLNKLIVEDKEDGVTLSMERLAQKSPESKNEMSDSWRLILQDNPALGDFLVRQSYRQSSFLPSPNQFHELIPFEWFLEKDYLGFMHADESIPHNQFLNQAVRRDNATEFFKYLKVVSSGNHYIINLSDKSLGMGKTGRAKGSSQRAPLYAVGPDGPIQLAGTVTTIEKAGTGTKNTVRAVYYPLNKVAKDQSNYDSNHSEFMRKVDPEGKENASQSTWTDIADQIANAFPDIKVIVNDVSDLFRSVSGQSFFRDPGAMVNLELEKQIKEDSTNDGALPEQMCG